MKTKRVKTAPYPDYAVEVRSTQLAKPVDHYLFCYWYPPKVYMLGWLEQQQFIWKSQEYAVGGQRAGRGGFVWVCSEQCRLAEISVLHPITVLSEQHTLQRTGFSLVDHPMYPDIVRSPSFNAIPGSSKEHICAYSRPPCPPWKNCEPCNFYVEGHCMTEGAKEFRMLQPQGTNGS